jgi:hypothetical protein
LRQPDTKLGTLVHPSDSPASLSPNLSKMLQTNSPKPPDPYEGFALFLWSVASCARGTYAQRAIGKAQEIFYENLKGKLPPNQEAKVYYFSLAPAEVPLPLGWMLSNRAVRAVGLNRLAPERFFVDVDDCGKRPTGSLGRRNRR